jgi:hypothetical protein
MNYRFRLDGQYSGSEKHFRIFFWFGFSNDFLVQQETGLHSPEHCRSRIHCSKCLLAEKQCGLGSYFQTCSVQSLNPRSFTSDNRSCIKLTENRVFHDRSKHIEMRYHYVRDMVQKNVLSIQYVPTAEQTTDIFTKPLSLTKFVYFCDKLGVAENASLAEREC